MAVKFPGLTLCPDTPKEPASESGRVVCRRLVLALEESQHPGPRGLDCGVCPDLESTIQHHPSTARLRGSRSHAGEAGASPLTVTPNNTLEEFLLSFL